MALASAFTRLNPPRPGTRRFPDIDGAGRGTVRPTAPGRVGSSAVPVNQGAAPTGFDELLQEFPSSPGTTASPAGPTDTSLAGRMALAAQLDDPTSLTNLGIGLMGLVAPSPVGLGVTIARAAMAAHNAASLQAGLQGLPAFDETPEGLAALMAALNEGTTGPPGTTGVSFTTSESPTGFTSPVAAPVGAFGPAGVSGTAGASATGVPGVEGVSFNAEEGLVGQPAVPSGGGGNAPGEGAPSGGESTSGEFRHGGPVGPSGGTVEGGEYVIPAGGFAEMLRAVHPKAFKHAEMAGLDPTDLLRLLPLLSPFLQKMLQGAPGSPAQPQGGPENEVPAPPQPDGAPSPLPGLPGREQPQRGPESSGSPRSQMAGIKRMVMEFHRG